MLGCYFTNVDVTLTEAELGNFSGAQSVVTFVTVLQNMYGPMVVYGSNGMAQTAVYRAVTAAADLSFFSCHINPLKWWLADK
jgi:hypothetical protein